MAQKKKYKEAEINFKITLEDNNLPVGIQWNSTDGTNKEFKECKSVAISLWDPEEKNTFSIDLWTKDMLLDEMEVYYFQTLMSLSESLQNATGNDFIVGDMKEFCDKVDKKLKKKREAEVAGE